MKTENIQEQSKFNFSVLMCVYNGDNAVHFETAVNSILNQSLKPSEVVLVVDGFVSQQINTVIEKFEENGNFVVVRLKENQGHGNARRAGLCACSNDLVAIMDADDVSCFERFEKQIEKFVEQPYIDVVGGNITEFIEEESNLIAKREVPCNDSEIKDYMKKRCPMNLVTVMFKKSSVEKAGGFLDWYCEEDYYLWIRMALENMVFANVSHNLVNVRVGSDMYKRRGGWKYFQSERKLQKFMRKNKIIGAWRYFCNVTKRFIVQCLLPNNLRGWIYKKFARQKI